MPSNFILKDIDKQFLVRTARESIHSKLEKREPEYGEPSNVLSGTYGAFVTLHIGKRLRGCIGTLRATECLFDTIKDMARSSAFGDPRFPSLTLLEFPGVTIEISVLTPLEKLHSHETVEVGRHGLYITRGSHSGVLLPQVPVEQSWNREEFLGAVCRKAGLPQNTWQDDDVDLYTFSAVVF